MSAKTGKRSKRVTNDDVEDTQSTDGTLVVALPLKVAKKKKKQTAPVKKRVTKDSTSVRGGGISKTRRLKKTQSDKVLRALADGENLDYLEDLISSLKKDEFEALRKKEEAKEKVATK